MAAIAVDAVCALAVGQVVRDGSLGRGPSALPGPEIQITPRHGRQVGSNLFHSFSQFDVGAKQRATFTGPNSVRNVLARVTSGTASRIDGTVASSIPDVNVYLMNPQGVIFGPGARLEISGSFAALSSDSIGLGKDTGTFSADPAARQVLRSDPPTSFGFLGPKSAGIQVNGARLAVNRGRELTLIGSGTQAKGAEPHGIVLRSGGETDRFGRPQGARLIAPDGRIDLIAVNGVGRVDRVVAAADNGREKTDSLNVSRVGAFGDISLARRTNVNVDGAAAGLVFSRGQSLSVRDSVVSAVTTGGGRSSGIDIELSNALNISGVYAGGPGGVGGVGVFADTQSTGAAGRITISAPRIRIEPRTRNLNGVQVDDVDGISTGSTRIVRDANGQRLRAGSAGNIDIDCDELILLRNGALRSESFGSDGDGGDIRVDASRLIHIDGTEGTFLTGVSTRTFPSNTENTGNTLTEDNTGRGGDIAITTAQLNLFGGARILSETGQFRVPRRGGSGSGGNIRIEAGHVDIRGFKPADPLTGSGIRSLAWQRTSGNAGDVAVIADRITIADGGTIEADTRGRGAAGLISIDALEISISGLNSSGREGADPSRISSQTTFASDDGGRGGSIIISTGVLALDDHGILRVGTGTQSTGTSGRIQISAEEVVVKGSARIDSSTGVDSSGDGGEIRFGSSFRPVSQLIVDSGRVLAVTGGSGDAGRITGSVGTLSVRNGGTISTESLAVSNNSAPAGRAGAVTLSARSFIEVDARSSIRTAALDADAGGIQLRVPADGMGIHVGGEISTAATGAGRRGGEILINAPMLHVAAGNSQASAPTPQSIEDDSFRGPRLTARAAGDGGNITLAATDSIIFRKALISGNTGRFGGSISMNPQTVVVDSSIIDGRSLGTPVPVSIFSNLLLSNDSQILTDAPAFTVNNDIAGTITAINARVEDPNKRLLETCAQRFLPEAGFIGLDTSAEALSSFIVEGRGGVPLSPGMPLPLQR